MENISSNWAIVRQDKGCTYIYLIEDRHSATCSPLYEDLFEDVEIVFNDNGTITFTGDEHKFEFTMHDAYLEEISGEVNPRFIKKSRILKKDIVRRGWYELMEKNHKELIIKNYTISKNG